MTASIVIDGRTYTGDARAAFEAGEARGKIVRGADIAKTVARRATEDERWRYGVELRITGSRWRSQTRAPHYPTPEPYVYRKRAQSLAWAECDHNRDIDRDYRAWLAARDEAASQPEAPKMADVSNSDDCSSLSAKLARAAGYRVHHDIYGWYVVAPDEDEPGNGYSLGFDGRLHHAICAEAWEVAARHTKPTADIVHLVTPTPAREGLAERKAAAAKLLREIAGGYGPRRAHKLRAMADWLTAPAEAGRAATTR